MGFVDDFVKLPDFLKIGILLLVALGASITFAGISIGETLLWPVFHLIGFALHEITGLDTDLTFPIFVVFLFVLGLLSLSGALSNH